MDKFVSGFCQTLPDQWELGLQACVEAVRGKTSGGRRKVARSVDDLDCTLCCKLLCRPVTAPCGHTFCQGCFQRSMDHSNKCEPSTPPPTVDSLDSSSFMERCPARHQEAPLSCAT